MQSIRLSFAITGFAVLLGTGCSTRHILDLPITPVEDAAAGTVVDIASVTDSRKFTQKTRVNSQPRTFDGQDSNTSLTSRTYAWVGDGPGGGDLVLPEGRTVPDVVREVVQKALRQKGYSVPNAAAVCSDAIPLKVEINQFWMWTEKGFFGASKLVFEAIIDIQSPLLITGRKTTVKGSVSRRAFRKHPKEVWRNIVQEGVENLEESIKEQLKTSATQLPAQGAVPTKGDAAARLLKLKELFDKEILTEGEYEAKRKELIDQL